MFLFCGEVCCEEYKRRNKVMALCDYCKIYKVIKDIVRYSGVDKPFCSEGKGVHYYSHSMEESVFTIFAFQKFLLLGSSSVLL